MFVSHNTQAVITYANRLHGLMTNSTVRPSRDSSSFQDTWFESLHADAKTSSITRILIPGGGDCECEAHIHSARIAFNRRIDNFSTSLKATIIEFRAISLRLIPELSRSDKYFPALNSGESQYPFQ